MSDDPLEREADEPAERPGTPRREDGAADDGPGQVEDLPALARLAASAAWHTAEWAARSYASAGLRLLRAASRPETAPELADDIRETVGGYAREVTGQGRPKRVQEGKDADEELWAELRVAGAEVMRKSRDVNYQETAHPAYERILEDMAPDEARILRLFMLDGPQPTIDVRTGGPLSLISSELIAQGISMIGARAGCRYPDRVPQYLNNLFRLGMIWFSRETLHDPVRYQVLEAQPETLEAAKSVRMAKIVRRSVHLTPFGEDLCRICLAIEGDEFDALPEHADPEEDDLSRVPEGATEPRSD